MKNSHLLIILLSSLILATSVCSNSKVNIDQIKTDDESSENEERIKHSVQALPKCVYNQAYQENYEEDSILDIINNAKDCYVLIDPFQSDVSDKIVDIKAKGNSVGCYISSGTGEDWRDDFTALQPFLVSKKWSQWDGEYFVNNTTTGILPLVTARIDKMADWGCDWVEFDNMDWIFDDEYRSEYRFQVSVKEGIAYNNKLCKYAQKLNMKCMAKNTRQGAGDFDGILFESYSDEKAWWDSQELKDFLTENKLAIINHYDEIDCEKTYNDYKKIYGSKLSFICEDQNLQKYLHYNGE